MTPQLANLERRLRRTERLLGVTVCLLGAVLLSGQALYEPWAGSTIEAERFVLRAPDGKVRGSMFVDTDGNARFALMDQGGKQRVILVADDASSGISVVSPDKQAGAGMVVPAGEVGAFGVFAGGRPQAEMRGNAAGQPSITLFDGDGKVRWSRAVEGEGAPVAAEVPSAGGEPTVKVWDSELRAEEGPWGSDYLRLYLHFENSSNRTLREVSVAVDIFDADGRLLHRGDYQQRVELLPGARLRGEEPISFQDNPFLGGQAFDKLAGPVAAEQAYVRATVTQVVTSDGELIELLNPPDAAPSP